MGNEKKKEYLGELEGKVKDFIQKHYSDNNLNVSMLGEEFNITSAYLSKIFKNHVGLSLHEYINMVRINKAKELLKREELTIAQIGQAVGYSNANAFIRVFKNYEGITPGKYKSML